MIKDFTETGRKAASSDHVYDVVGVGVGPANLAVAVAMEDDAEAGASDLDRLFLDARESPAWHPGMLLEGSQLQLPVLKDLALLRNPRSRFTFLNFLNEKGRLNEFLNIGTLYPSRLEFNQYLSWVAEQLGDRLVYGQRVVGVEGVARSDGQPIRELDVIAENPETGEQTVRRTRSLILGTGGIPMTPPGVDISPDAPVIHSSQFMQRIADYDRQGSYRFVVVGGGQSGAELFQYLMNHFPKSDVTATLRRWSYKPVDDSDFTNEIFFPDNVDLFHELPEEKRELIHKHVRNVNYSVVDLPLIHQIYRDLYDLKVLGDDRARLRRYLELKRVEERAGKAIVTFEDMLHERPETFEADALILATGYNWPLKHPLLEGISDHFELDETGRFDVDRQYKVVAKPSLEAAVFVPGFCEPSHGPSEPVLSLNPVRADHILKSLAGRPVDDRVKALA